MSKSQVGIKPNQVTSALALSPEKTRGIWRIDSLIGDIPAANAQMFFNLAPPPGHTMQVQLATFTITNNGAVAARVSLQYIFDTSAFAVGGNLGIGLGLQAVIGFGVKLNGGSRVSDPLADEIAVCGLPDIWVPKPFIVQFGMQNGAFTVSKGFLVVETRPYPVQ